MDKRYQEVFNTMSDSSKMNDLQRAWFNDLVKDMLPKQKKDTLYDIITDPTNMQAFETMAKAFLRFVDAEKPPTQPVEAPDQDLVDSIDRVLNAIEMLTDPDYLDVSSFFNASLNESYHFLMDQRRENRLGGWGPVVFWRRLMD
jgi:hypothetical protein